MEENLNKLKALINEVSGAKTPQAYADLRIKLATQLAVIGALMVDAKDLLNEAKDEIPKKYLYYREEGKSIEDSKMRSKAETSATIRVAEYNYEKLRQFRHNGTELLNAISTKLRTLELEARNQH